MDHTEIRKLADLEDDHWWYRERRVLLARDIAELPTGTALDIGAAGGGNTRVLREAGWQAIALEYGEAGAEIARGRGLPVIRADATALPCAPASMDAVVALDVLEHLADDDAAVREIHRVLRPGGLALIAVPADPRLWSAHDEAVGHVRRYTRPELVDLFVRNGFTVESTRSWNVLLRPVVALRRRSSAGSDLEQMNPVVNRALRAVVALERVLPVGRWPGVSLRLRARAR
ncbi:MAG: class I SAM-dependent methyltransferase [Ornithinimicrobium sp.]